MTRMSPYPDNLEYLWSIPEPDLALIHCNLLLVEWYCVHLIDWLMGFPNVISFGRKSLRAESDLSS